MGVPLGVSMSTNPRQEQSFILARSSPGHAKGRKKEKEKQGDNPWSTSVFAVELPDLLSITDITGCWLFVFN